MLSLAADTSFLLPYLCPFCAWWLDGGAGAECARTGVDPHRTRRGNSVIMEVVTTRFAHPRKCFEACSFFFLH